MEAVRISCAGFAYKQPYAAVLSYFYPLQPSALHALVRAGGGGVARSHSDSELRSPRSAAGGGEGALPHTAAHALQHQPVDALIEAAKQLLAAGGVTAFHLGKTKLFMKSEQAASLDRQRGVVLARSALRIQAVWRGHGAAQRYAEMKAAALRVQTAFRASAARALAARLRAERAALVVQCAWRRCLAQRVAATRQAAVVSLQCAWRSHLARQALLELRRCGSSFCMWMDDVLQSACCQTGTCLRSYGA
jgi:myosin-5